MRKISLNATDRVTILYSVIVAIFTLIFRVKIASYGCHLALLSYPSGSFVGSWRQLDENRNRRCEPMLSPDPVRTALLSDRIA
jgi:hypothetical protein